MRIRYAEVFVLCTLYIVREAAAVQSAGPRLVGAPPFSAGPQYFHRFCGTSSTAQTHKLSVFSLRSFSSAAYTLRSKSDEGEKYEEVGEIPNFVRIRVPG